MPRYCRGPHGEGRVRVKPGNHRADLCRSHWNQVPAQLREQVIAAWEDWDTDFGDLNKMRAYGQVRDEAIKSVTPY